MRRVVLALAAVALGCGERAPEPRAGLLDHGPHHGGVVMAGPRVVLEMKASADGTVRVWLGDGWRRPLPLDGVRGSARLRATDGPRDVALESDGEALCGDERHASDAREQSARGEPG